MHAGWMHSTLRGLQSQAHAPNHAKKKGKDEEEKRTGRDKLPLQTHSRAFLLSPSLLCPPPVSLFPPASSSVPRTQGYNSVLLASRVNGPVRGPVGERHRYAPRGSALVRAGSGLAALVCGALEWY